MGTTHNSDPPSLAAGASPDPGQTALNDGTASLHMAGLTMKPITRERMLKVAAELQQIRSDLHIQDREIRRLLDRLDKLTTLIGKVGATLT